jgi:hypothetical protein
VKISNTLVGGMAAALLGAAALPAAARTPEGLNDLIGVRESSGVRAMQDRGYRQDHAYRRDDGDDVFWWSSSRNECVRVFVRDAHYDRVDAVGPDECGRQYRDDYSRHDDHHYDRGWDEGGDARYTDLIGRRDDDADRILRDRGFDFLGKESAESGGGHERVYWRGRSKQCVWLRTRGGSVIDIRSLPKGACRQGD